MFLREECLQATKSGIVSGAGEKPLPGLHHQVKIPSQLLKTLPNRKRFLKGALVLF